MSDSDGQTIASMAGKVARSFGEKAALSGIAGAPSLSHDALARFVEQTGQQLRGWGIGRGDIVLISVPDGPAALTAFLSVASVATAFPVPPLEPRQVWENIFNEVEVQVKAVLMMDRPTAPLVEVAATHGAKLLRMTPGHDRPAGCFEVTVDRADPAREDEGPYSSDIALMAMTTGSTAAPKIVASTHRSLLDGIGDFAAQLGLASSDRSLCVMPFAHMHSLIRSALPIWASGGEVVWTPGFQGARIIDWINACKPTYMSGAPAIFQALLEKAADRGWTPPPGVLKVAAVGSDRVSPDLVHRLRQEMQAKVVQFYGMTETSPFIALTPRNQSTPDDAVGQVNPRWDVAILDDAGLPVEAGKRGEIAVRGGHINPVVSRSLACNSQVDDAGRLRTGDLGRLDAAGFLYVVGRVDDRISRGAEKIMPDLVEAVLRRHPHVAQAAAFGVPDRFLGQRLVSIVQLAHGADSHEAEVRLFAAALLPSHMVPERVLVVQDIPVNDVGKISRNALADTYAYLAGNGARALLRLPFLSTPSTTLEHDILELLRQHARQPSMSAGDGFFESGGDSLAAIELLLEIEQRFGASLSPAVFLQEDSAIGLARAVAAYRGQAGVGHVEILAGAQGGGRLILAPGIQGAVEYAPALATALKAAHEIWVLHAPKLELDETVDRDVMTIGADMAAMVMKEKVDGPVAVAGFSMGAHVALGMIHRFVDYGQPVSLLAVFDDEAELDHRYVAAKSRSPSDQTVEAYNKWALDRCAAKPFHGRVVYFRAESEDAYHRSDPTGGWGEIALGGVEIIPIGGSHESILRSAGVDNLAEALDSVLKREAGHAAPVGGEMERARRLRYAARAAARAGDTKREIDLYQEVIGHDPDQPFWAYGNLAEALLDAGDTATAETAYLGALTRDPWPLTTELRFAHRFAGTALAGRLDAAISRVRKITPDHVSVAEQKGRLFIAAGEFDDAETTLAYGLEMDATHLWTRVRLAEMLAHRGRQQEATAHMETVVDLNPSSYWLYALLAENYLSAGRPGDVLTLIDRAPGHIATSYSALVCQGQAFLQLGRRADAKDAFSNAAAIRPGSKDELTGLFKKKHAAA